MWLRVSPSESARGDVYYPGIIPTRGQGTGIFVSCTKQSVFMLVHIYVNSQAPPLLYKSQQSKFWRPEGSPLAKGCKWWLLEEWKHMVSYVPKIEMWSRGDRTQCQQHLQGGTLLSVNDTHKVVGERLSWRPVVKTSPFNTGLVVLIPGQGAKGFPGSIALRIHLPMQETQDTAVWFLVLDDPL